MGKPLEKQNKKLEGSLQAKASAHRACAALLVSEGAMSVAACDALPSFPLFATTVPSVRIAFFPARFRQARKGGVLMRRLWHVLEVVAIYALKRLIDWFFTTKN